MAQPLICDVCGTEEAVQMINNLTDGSVMTLGPACIPEFFAQATATLWGTGQHEGPRTKCPACRTMHEQMTGGVTAIATDPVPTDLEIEGQMAIDDAVRLP